MPYEVIGGNGSLNPPPKHGGGWGFPLAVGAATYLWFQHEHYRDQAWLANWHAEREVVAARQNAHQDWLIRQYQSYGYSDEMVAEWTVYSMNNDPVIAQERKHYNIGPTYVLPEWAAEMAAKRKAEAPPPMPPQPNLQAIRDLLGND